MFTRKIIIAFLLMTGVAGAEVHSLTLQQALELASRQNPDIALARLDEQRAQEGIRVAQDPFRPKVFAGSGLAYTYGYPNSIEGNAPSLFEVRTDMALYNRPKSYQVAAAREVAHGAQFAVAAKADEVAYQAADLFLTASQMEHQSSTLAAQLPSLQKVMDSAAAGVKEGSQLPIDLKRARVDLAMSQQQLEGANLDADYYEMMLAVALGFPAADRVKPVDSEFASILTPPTEDAAADTALNNSRELREIQSNVLAKQLDLRAFKAARLPTVDLVAQYALFAKYNYTQYFQKFQRNNFQLGASVAIPLLVGSASSGLAQQAATDLQKLKVQMDQTRNRILAETRRSYEQWKKAESIRDLAFMQLDLAREQLSVLLAQNQEGRTALKDVEQARLEESNKWMTWYDAEMQVARAKFAILRQTGSLLAAVRAGKGAAQPE
ncbi:MAG: TolC family protein [Acidobacteriaceae bacterium]|nr:TolC family protein [Acidobacteriaceae bacterium]